MFNVILAIGFTARPICLVEFLTGWTLLLQTLSMIVTIKCSLDPNINSKIGWLALCHTLFEILLCLNCLVLFVYWPVIHKVALADWKINKPQYYEQPGQPNILYMYTVHSMP